MRRLLAIAVLELRRFLRDRSNIFFVFIFPLLLVLVIGSQFGGGGSGGSVAISGPGTELRAALTTELEDDDVEVSHDDAEDIRERVARGRVDVGVFLDAGDQRSYEAGEDLELAVVGAGQQGSQVTMERVRTAASATALRRGQVLALRAAGVPAGVADEALDEAARSVPEPRLAITDVDEVAQEFSGLGQFDLSAAASTLLFVFLISLAGSTTLIQGRRLGVVGRTLAAPVTSGQVLLGQALGRWAIAMFQGLYIMVATVLLFDVDWGTLWLAALVLAVFAAVAAGAAMLLGSLLDNEGAAVGVGVGLGLVLGAIGGSMLPLELFPETLRTVSHLTPHAWAYEAFADLQRHDGTLLDVLPELGVLLAMAVVVLALGSWALRRSLARGM